MSRRSCYKAMESKITPHHYDDSYDDYGCSVPDSPDPDFCDICLYPECVCDLLFDDDQSSAKDSKKEAGKSVDAVRNKDGRNCVKP